MPFNPGAEFNPNAAMGAVTQGFGALGAGIADMQKKRDDAEAQMAGSMFGFQTLKTAGLISDEEQQKFLAGNANQRNAIVMQATPRLLQKHQEMQMSQQRDQADMQRALTERVAQMHITSAEKIAGMRTQGAQFAPPPETIAQMKESGYTWAPVSGRAGRWINTTGGKPDLDEAGNPKYTADGTAFVSGGKLHPLTQPMQDARAEWLKKQQAAKDLAGPHWYDKFMPSSPTPTPAQPQAAPDVTPAPVPTPQAGPVKVNTPEEANALPSGTMFLTPDGRLKRKP